MAAAALIILLLEFTLGNLSSWKSLFYQEQSLLSQMEISDSSLTFPSIDQNVRNLHLDIELPRDIAFNYTISLTDQGNAYPYTLPRQAYLSAVPSTAYVNLYPYGEVKSMTLNFDLPEDVPFQILDISINSHRPLIMNWLRVLILYCLFLFFYLLRIHGKLVKLTFDPNSRLQNGITLGVVILLLLSGFFLTGSNKLFTESSKPHHQQYKELAVALSQGHFYVDDSPSSGLLEAENPYDTIYLQANGIEYRMDYAYYNGKYYVYFGIVPELLLYLPIYLLTGRQLPNHAAVFVFYAGFVIALFLLLRQLAGKFSKLPYIAYLLTGTMIAACGTYSYLIGRADLYHVPIMAGICFTSMGLLFWMLGLRHERLRLLFFFLGSLCMALVAGCRPQMLLFSFLAIPIFRDLFFRQWKLFSPASRKETVCQIICLALPYVLAAAGLMYYNQARFGSPFDFGATYSLTNNDMNLRGFSLERMLYGLLCFLFQPPAMNGVFPFLTDSSVTSSFMGRLITEFFYGGIITCHVLTWVLAALLFARKQLKEKGLLLWLLIPLGASLVIGLVDANQAGILQRYSADMAFGIFFSCALLLFYLMEQAILKEKIYPYAIRFLSIGFLLQIFYAFMIVFALSGGINLEQYNPELFYRAAALFRF